ncbi:MAG: hypothetical protein ACHQIM_18190, partial [Sphingobacteriales bacterium]
YQALVLLSGDTKLSTKRISKITGLEREYVSVIRRKYLLAKLLGINVKKVVDNVLLSHISISLPIETYFCFCVIQYLVDAKRIEHAKIFLFSTGELCKRMNIEADEIENPLNINEL